MKHLLLLPIVVFIFTFTFWACSDDSADFSRGTLVVSANPSSIPADGSQSAEISVTATNSSSEYFPSGTKILLVSDSEPQIGRFAEPLDEESPGTSIKTIYNTSGTITTRFYCTAPGVTNIIANVQASNFTRENGGLAIKEITCVEGLRGDWQISQVQATPPFIQIDGAESTIQASAVDGDENPVPNGTVLEFSTTSTSSTFSSGETTQEASTTNGSASATLRSGTEIETATVTVSFKDQRQGTGSESTNITVDETSIEDPTLILISDLGDGETVPITLLADGESSIHLTATLFDDRGNLVPEQEITFSTTSGYFHRDRMDTVERATLVLTTNELGVAECEFVGGVHAGRAEVQASAGELSDSVMVEIIELGFIQFLEVTPRILGVKHSGWNESAQVTFQVLDTSNQPFPGVEVVLEIENSTAGISLAPSHPVSDAQGIVTTNLSSGTEATIVTIRATAIVGEKSLPADSPAIPIVGAKPTSSGFALSCDIKNVGALIDTDGISSLIDIPITCNSLLKDRFNNPIGKPTSVLFRAEAGTITASTMTVAYDISRPPEDPQPNVGRVYTVFQTFGRLPYDTTPFEEDEPSVEGSDGRIHNPRDGLVTILAFTDGEEEFDDVNRNGDYDEGELFTDLGEPFLDYNDNNTREPFEPFIDLAGDDEIPNGEYDGPNEQWDSSTKIWTETRILWTGNPAVDTRTNQFSRAEKNGRPLRGSDLCPGMGEEFVPFEARWMDENLNILNASATYGGYVSYGDVNVGTISGVSFPDQYGFTWEKYFEEVEPGRSVIKTRIAGFSQGSVSGMGIEFTDMEGRVDFLLQLTASYGTAPGGSGLRGELPVEGSCSF